MSTVVIWGTSYDVDTNYDENIIPSFSAWLTTTELSAMDIILYMKESNII